MTRRIAWLLLGFTAAAAAQAPTPKDYAYGVRATIVDPQPVQQLALPDRVYRGIARADLRDLRVFNAAGVAVPHALCHGPERAASRVHERPLPLFTLNAGRPPDLPVDAGRTRIDVRSPSGASIQIVEPTGAAVALSASPDEPQAVVLDASSLQHPLRALTLAWSTPDGASEAQVRVESSDDLDHWRVAVQATTLLHVTADGRSLERNRIELPAQPYRYLRLSRSDGPPVRIDQVTAEVVEPAPPPAPTWFAAEPRPEDDGGFLFDAARLAPIEAARVNLPAANMALRVALESRATAAAAWQTRWVGDVSSVPGVQAMPIAFAAASDRAWRLRVLRGAESLGSARPTLELGYHAARLRFLAQGEGPYLIAYGSVRAALAEPVACDQSVAWSAGHDTTPTGSPTVDVAPVAIVGGQAALEVPKPPTPLRQIMLWVSLLAGTAVLLAMALALLRRLRSGPP